MAYKAIYVQPGLPHDNQQTLTADVCQEQDKSPVRTGLLDASGTPIYRIADTIALGFGLPK